MLIYDTITTVSNCELAQTVRINIDGKIVISAISGNKSMGAELLHLGNIVLSVDGVSIEDRISNCKEYISLSNENRFVAAFGFYLLGTDNDTAVIEVLRDGSDELLDKAVSLILHE